jgi:hypothetical protein
MEVTLVQHSEVARGTPTESELHLTLSRDEAATIWFALEAYKEQVHKDLEKVLRRKDIHQTEDEAFLFGVGRNIAALQFALLYDHVQDKQQAIRNWMGVE